MINVNEFPTKNTTKSVTPKPAFTNITKTDLLMFTRELRTVLESGLDIISGLFLMSQQTQKKEFNSIINKIVTNLSSGTYLSQSLSEFPWLFDNIYRGSIRAGEYNGNICKSLANLEHLLEKEISMKRKLSQALIYPSTALTICIVFTFITFKFLLPNLIEFLNATGNTLPLPTQILILITNIISYPLTVPLIIIACIIMALLFKSYTSMASGRYAFHLFLLSMPIIGTLMKKIAYINITNSLSSCLDTGLSLIRSVKLAGAACGNAVFEQNFNLAIEGINEGIPLSDFIKKNQMLYGKVFASMLLIGEESGSIPEISKKLSNLYEIDVDNALASVSVIIEPFLIAITGSIIGFVMLGVFLPLYQTISNLG